MPSASIGEPDQLARARAGTTSCGCPFAGTTRAVNRSWEDTECPAKYCRSAPGAMITTSAPAAPAGAASRVSRSAKAPDTCGSAATDAGAEDMIGSLVGHLSAAEELRPARCPFVMHPGLPTRAP